MTIHTLNDWKEKRKITSPTTDWIRNAIKNRSYFFIFFFDRINRIAGGKVVATNTKKKQKQSNALRSESKSPQVTSVRLPFPEKIIRENGTRVSVAE